MTGPNDQRLHQFVHERAGDGYRALVRYDADEWEVLYVREDLSSETIEAAIPQIAEQLRERHALVREEESPMLGGVNATLEVHDDGVLLHLPEGSASGVVVSLDQRVARHLVEFIVQCTSVLNDGGTAE